MANIKLNKKQFEKEIGKLDEKMQEKISLFGTPIGAITDEEVELEVFPNRPDLLSYYGFKRAFLAYLGKKTGLKKYKVNPPKKDYVVRIDSSVKDVRPFTACAIVSGLKLTSDGIKDMIDLQERLHATVGRKRKKMAIGIYPLEEIKLPITYMAFEPDKIKFMPLGAEKEMSGLEILEKHPVGKEYAPLLAGKSKFPIFIDSQKNILSMPPVINSALTGRVTEKTTSVFVECSGFDFESLKKCLNIIVTSLAEMGGEIYQMELEYDKSKKQITPDLSTSKEKISLENTNKLIGIKIDEKSLKSLLEKMGYEYSKGVVEVPAWRTDILHEVDLIEDVAVAYGYDNLIPEIPEVATNGEEQRSEVIKRKIAEILVGTNMLETSNYHLTTQKNQFVLMGFKEKSQPDCTKIESSKTDYNILRTDLSHYALKVLSENLDKEYPQRLFEIGKVFTSKSQTEEEHLAVSISPGNFTELNQVLNYLFKMINLKVKTVEPDKIPLHFIKGRVAEIILEKQETKNKETSKSVGFIGEIHPEILKNWKIRMPVALLEINLEEIFELIK